MKRIVLLCNGGLSTGILVKKMKQVACPVTSIDPVSYGTMNGEKVLNQVKKELGEA